MGRTEIKMQDVKNDALQLFAKRGYHNTSMQDIANLAGVNKATLYFHFKCKKDLYIELLDDVIPVFESEIKRVVANVMDRPLESVMKAVFFVFINYLSYHHLLLWKRTDLMTTTDFDTEIQQSARDMIEKRDKVLLGLYRSIVHEKKPDMPRDELEMSIYYYYMFIKGFTDWMFLRTSSTSQEDVITMAEKLWQKFWNGAKIE